MEIQAQVQSYLNQAELRTVFKFNYFSPMERRLRTLLT